MNVFEIEDIRRIIFSFIYPTVIKPGMIMKYMGSKKPKQYLNNYIGKLYIIEKYANIDFFCLNVDFAIMAKGIDTNNCVFFSNEDNIKIILV
tara:strand:+ start:84 stop:359 length:276 start_codon:yes stop_codon:yes gene_type:complete